MHRKDKPEPQAEPVQEKPQAKPVQEKPQAKPVREKPQAEPVQEKPLAGCNVGRQTPMSDVYRVETLAAGDVSRAQTMFLYNLFFFLNQETSSKYFSKLLAASVEKIRVGYIAVKLDHRKEKFKNFKSLWQKKRFLSLCITQLQVKSISIFSAVDALSFKQNDTKNVNS